MSLSVVDKLITDIRKSVGFCIDDELMSGLIILQPYLVFITTYIRGNELTPLVLQYIPSSAKHLDTSFGCRRTLSISGEDTKNLTLNYLDICSNYKSIK